MDHHAPIRRVSLTLILTTTTDDGLLTMDYRDGGVGLQCETVLHGLPGREIIGVARRARRV